MTEECFVYTSISIFWSISSSASGAATNFFTPAAFDVESPEFGRIWSWANKKYAPALSACSINIGSMSLNYSSTKLISSSPIESISSWAINLALSIQYGPKRYNACM